MADTSSTLSIISDDLSDARVIALLEEHLRELHSLSPACSVHVLDIDALKGPKVEFYKKNARQRGYERLSLETGSQSGFLPARRFYERHGFTQTEPFAQYTHDPASVFYTINLQV